MIAGIDPVGGPPNCGDTTGSFSYPMDLSYACVTFGGTPQFTTLSGLVNDMYSDPIESVHVVVEGVPTEYGEYWTEPDGFYSVIGDYGNRNVTFTKAGHIDAVYEDYEMAISEQTLNVTLYPVAEDETVFWFGNLDGSPVSASIGRKLNIDVFTQSSTSAYGGAIHIPLALEQQYFDSLVSASSGSYYYPFTEWETAGFEGPYGAPPNPAGWVSESFIADVGTITVAPWLHMAAPIKILTFAAQVIDNPLLDGTTVACLAVGAHPESLPMGVGDTLTGVPYTSTVYLSELAFTLGAPNFPYLPGDVNMWGCAWPPSARGGDVTYLVNYFRSVPTSHACFIDGFWASADINGDCAVIGSDVTKLVNCFRGLTEKSYCPDYPPAWLTPADLPEEMPLGWPPCE